MAQNLIIVESPAKMKTIKKFLGRNYTVDASMGHIRDLPKSSMGVDVEHDFEPKYITIRGKGDLVASLKKEVKKADVVYLATDPDREGEAISWHLMSALNLDPAEKPVRRISFNEITEKAVKSAIKNPRAIDMNLVDAQQARRVMDRLVGYSLSPILWEKIKRGLSAGRVQSAALYILAKRDAEIAAFVPKEYWTVDAVLKNGAKEIKASYYGENGVKKGTLGEAEAKRIVEDVRGKKLTVAEVKAAERVKQPPLPFTTSTMQQEASRLLNMSTSKTMSTAQRLYEGVEVKGRGSVGLITYLRTDSTRISDEAFEAAKSYIGGKYGKDYVSFRRPAAKANGNVQDAHEAIRPTYLDISPESVKDQLPRDEYRLYQLIYNRFLASRMTPAVYNAVSVRADAGSHSFSINGSTLTFDGFLKLYKDKQPEEEQNQDLSFLKTGDGILFTKIAAERHQTEPPAHYTEAALVRELEELGIGRPSTYAPTIATLLARHYVSREKRSLYVTELGQAVNDFMTRAFPDVVDTGFTAQMETDLDKVAEGKLDWKELLRGFYPGFEKETEKAREGLEKIKVPDQVSDVPCDKCGRMMVIKYGPHGKFLACPGFPECRNTKPLIEKADFACPKCGKDVLRLRTKKGRLFYRCEDRDGCDFISWNKPRRDAKEEKQD